MKNTKKWQRQGADAERKIRRGGSLELTQGSPLKVIFLFAVPILIGQLFQMFYSVVDVRIVGEILGEEALAAVGATSTLSDLMIGLMNGFTNGCAIIVAIYYGAGDQKSLKKALGATVSLGLGTALIVGGLNLLFLPEILKFLNVQEALVPQARQYVSIVLGGLVCATMYNVCAAILRAVGDSFTPLLFLIFSSLLNIGLDYFFVGSLSLGVSGAALATVLSQTASAVLCFFYMRVRYTFLKIDSFCLLPEREVLWQLLASGGSMAFMISFVQLGTLALQVKINTFGSATIVAHTAARKVTGIFMLPFSVLGSALATFCGQNLGAGKFGRIRTGIFQAVIVAWGWCLVVILLTYTLAPQLVGLIVATDAPEILGTATAYLRFDTLFYFVPAVISLFRNSMQGLGDTKTPVFSSFLELAGKILVVLFLTPALQYTGIILAEPCVWIIMVIPLIVNLLRNPVMKKQEVKKQEMRQQEEGGEKTWQVP